MGLKLQLLINSIVTNLLKWFLDQLSITMVVFASFILRFMTILSRALSWVNFYWVKLSWVWLIFSPTYVIWENKPNLTSRTELLVNFKRVELELKKEFVSNSSRVSSRTNSYRVESSSDRFDSTRLISSLIYSPSLNRFSVEPVHSLNRTSLLFLTFWFWSCGCDLIFLRLDLNLLIKHTVQI